MTFKKFINEMQQDIINTALQKYGVPTGRGYFSEVDFGCTDPYIEMSVEYIQYYNVFEAKYNFEITPMHYKSECEDDSLSQSKAIKRRGECNKYDEFGKKSGTPRKFSVGIEYPSRVIENFPKKLKDDFEIIRNFASNQNYKCEDSYKGSISAISQFKKDITKLVKGINKENEKLNRKLIQKNRVESPWV